jgi:hypothetical protein
MIMKSKLIGIHLCGLRRRIILCRCDLSHHAVFCTPDASLATHVANVVAKRLIAS